MTQLPSPSAPAGFLFYPHPSCPSASKSPGVQNKVMKYFSTRGGSQRLSFEDVRWLPCSPLWTVTLDHLIRPSLLDLPRTEGCISQNTSPLSLRIGRRNGNPIRSSNSPSRSFPSTSPKTRSLATICGNWPKNPTAHSVIRKSLRSKNSTRSYSFLSFSTARRLHSRMLRSSCLEIYLNFS